MPMSNFYDISAYISYFNKYFDSETPEGFPSHSYETPEVLLLAAKKEFPNHPWPYLQLGKKSMERGDYFEALSVYEEMSNNIPKNNDGFLGRMEALIALENFEEVELLYCQRFEDYPQQKLNSDDAFILIERLIRTKAFPYFSSVDFSELSFIKHAVQDNVDFLYKISNVFMGSLFHEYIGIANQYVTDHGGRFVYISMDNVFMVENKSSTEKELLALKIWDPKPDFAWFPWLRSCPPHMIEMYGELPQFSIDYIHNILPNPSNIVQGTKIVPASFTSKFVNVEKSLRKTSPSLEKASNKIKILGGSDVFGFGCEDAHTISSFLQQKLLEDSSVDTYKVENHGLLGHPLLICINSLLQQKISQGDIIVLFGYPKLKSIPPQLEKLENFHCNLSRPHSHGEIFIDYCHPGWNGNKVIANKIFQYLFSQKDENNFENYTFKASVKLDLANASIELIKYLIYKKSSETCEKGEVKNYIDYIKNIKINVDGKVGSVAVNCNPLTSGHIHLLEYAASNVDHLYVFVIEEDLSFFPFRVRLQLVQEGLAHLSNVTVLRGGRYICTQFTYPEYYSKEESPNVIADASMEAWFFCEYIAKALDISVIFLGEEPICKVTNQYNQQMKEILPKHKIEVDIIPRVSFDDSVISASHVRKLLRDNEMNKIRKIVPDCTYRYLLKTKNK